MDYNFKLEIEITTELREIQLIPNCEDWALPVTTRVN